VLVAVAVVLAALLVVMVVVTVALVLEAVSGAEVLATGLDPPQPARASTPSIDRTVKQRRTREVSPAVG
jgi:hypothetical protein